MELGRSPATDRSDGWCRRGAMLGAVTGCVVCVGGMHENESDTMIISSGKRDDGRQAAVRSAAQ